MYVDVEINLNDISNSELIEHLTDEGYIVLEKENLEDIDFSSDVDRFKHIRACLGLREHETREVVVKELLNLMI